MGMCAKAKKGGVRRGVTSLETSVSTVMQRNTPGMRSCTETTLEGCQSWNPSVSTSWRVNPLVRSFSSRIARLCSETSMSVAEEDSAVSTLAATHTVLLFCLQALKQPPAAFPFPAFCNFGVWSDFTPAKETRAPVEVEVKAPFEEWIAAVMT